ncbi:formate-dependent phosphoribosylglycinamide formyltransferase [Sphingomonas histidinilytica]|uniref:Formate-dependent phosphoribosylglycinamide formyltransferase n=1 Tax=Rhizorhabdus histidinilytica TaxID=439228 RepID=A0A1T5CTP7_9SPHN|nr:formate-dependent phosphoribosylglycinamide formyltransferase [Rhizorhabdus histidinilytica]MBO9379118.1 formate-dependent phosphoribosylglycinamide formyltransferase [Rhizorhabdus histidinilytica]SKB62691.1 formate-dependent phosphoribosylglycinamide formyltransferase [Rhizorhabdus histidinilytica]
MRPVARILLLGSGELGREFTIAAKRLGAYVIACDSYEKAPAMQVADDYEVLSMLDDEALAAVIEKHRPDHIVPEVEAIRTEVLLDFEDKGYSVVPSARATMLTMNRDRIRDVAANELGLVTSRFLYAETLEEMRAAVKTVGIPCVVKPVMSSSGKGQSIVTAEEAVDAAWDYAVEGMRGDRQRVIVEAFIAFDYEITLLTIRTRQGVLFCEPIGHRQELGDYRESWQPTPMSKTALAAAQDMARKVVDDLGGYGLFGVEFFVAGEQVIFSELSPRPHDTGMVTLISQNLTEFDLHARAILGLPIPHIHLNGASASAVLLADRHAEDFRIEGLAEALAPAPGVETDVRLFSKPVTRPNRRMGVALALAREGTADDARAAARAAVAKLSIVYAGEVQ